MYGTAPSLAQDSSQSENPANRWTDSQKLSYILGTQLGQLNQTGELTLDGELIIRGLKDFTRDNDLLMSPQEIQTFMADMQRKEQEMQMAAMNTASEENLRKGAGFSGSE